MTRETTAAGKWREAGVPHRGWTCIGIEDLDEPSHVCEMCEAAEVRYVHLMRHPDYLEDLAVGCICAGHMTGDVEGARRQEAEFKNTEKRRARWLTRDWRISHAGNEFLNVSGLNVVVYPRSAGWEARFANDEKTVALPLCQTQDEAKLAAFDMLLRVEAVRRERDLKLQKPQ